jgi:enoyl-CoA hydratase/carnithine racemase
VLYEKRGEVAVITLNRPEVKNAIDVETHELLCHIWRDFRDDPALRVAVITGTGDAFTAGADLKTHAPEWQTIGLMVGRERLEDGLCGITRGPPSCIKKPIVAAINGWCVGHGVELAMACDIRIASDRCAVRHLRGASRDASGRRRRPASGQHLRDGAITTVLRQSRSRPQWRDSDSPLRPW